MARIGRFTVAALAVVGFLDLVLGFALALADAELVIRDRRA